MGTTLFSSPVLCNENPSFLFKAQAAGKIHSSFYSLSSAINSSTGAYVLESANKLFGEKSSRFKEVSETCNLSGRAPNLQQVHFQSCSLIHTERVRTSHWLTKAPQGHWTLSNAAVPLLPCGFFLSLLHKSHLQRNSKEHSRVPEPLSSIPSLFPCAQSLSCKVCRKANRVGAGVWGKGVKRSLIISPQPSSTPNPTSGSPVLIGNL